MTALTASFTHLIPASAVAREINDIEQRLASTGYDPTGLDFEGAARQKLVKDVVEIATEAGVQVVQTGWQSRSSGAIDIAIKVAQDADLVALELALH
jgi:hypothetical protein